MVTAGGLLSAMGGALVGGMTGWHRSRMDGVAGRDRSGDAGEEGMGLVVVLGPVGGLANHARVERL